MVGLTVDTNWKADFWTEVFDKVRKKGRIQNAALGEYAFEYALINPKDRYGANRISTTGSHYEYIGRNVTFWIKDAEKQAGLNIAGLAFVFERRLPHLDFADYVALHEHIESLEFDANERKWHGNACMIELEEVFKREAEFVGAYASWLIRTNMALKHPERGYFGRAIPDFVQVLKDGRLPPVEIITEFKRQLNEGYHLH